MNVVFLLDYEGKSTLMFHTEHDIEAKRYVDYFNEMAESIHREWSVDMEDDIRSGYAPIESMVSEMNECLENKIVDYHFVQNLAFGSNRLHWQKVGGIDING